MLNDQMAIKINDSDKKQKYETAIHWIIEDAEINLKHKKFDSEDKQKIFNAFFEDLSAYINYPKELIEAYKKHRRESDQFPKPFDIRNNLPKKESASVNIDFEHYKFAFVYTSFRLSGEEQPDEDRIKDEIEYYSKYLANTKLIDYNMANGNACKRHISKKEYDEISNLRMNAGTGRLLPYSEVKYFESKVIASSELDNIISEASKSILNLKKEYWFNKEPDFEPNF